MKRLSLHHQMGWQAADEDTWNKCMVMCQTGCQESTDLHEARNRGPWHEGLCLAMKGTSMRTEQQKTTVWASCGISGIIYQINSQETFHKPHRQKARKEDSYSY